MLLGCRTCKKKKKKKPLWSGLSQQVDLGERSRSVYDGQTASGASRIPVEQQLRPFLAANENEERGTNFAPFLVFDEEGSPSSSKGSPSTRNEPE